MNPLVFIAVLAGVALILVLVGKGKDIETAQYRCTAVQVQGIVVRNETCWQRNVVTRPIIRFITRDGSIIEAMDDTDIGFAIPRFHDGQKIVLIYQISNPCDFRIISQGTIT